ncbi:MAG: hypothetical protein ABGY75_00830, partial [Gemmataceae bacterium]
HRVLVPGRAGWELVGARWQVVTHAPWHEVRYSLQESGGLLRLRPEKTVGRTFVVEASLPAHGEWVRLALTPGNWIVALGLTMDFNVLTLDGRVLFRGRHPYDEVEYDLPDGVRLYREAVAGTGITDVTNRAVRVPLGSESLWLAGVDDLWWGKPDQAAALGEVPAGAAVVLLSHNPDFAELHPDPRVGLVLSGHTHGGQAYLPGVGAAWLPSKFGDKYRAGLVRGPASAVYVSRGLGEAGVPLRLNCPPEINLLELIPG